MHLVIGARLCMGPPARLLRAGPARTYTSHRPAAVLPRRWRVLRTVLLRARMWPPSCSGAATRHGAAPSPAGPAIV